MQDLDRMLGALRDEPAPARLAMIDAAVMRGIAARHEREFARRGMILAACIAASFGLALGFDGGRPASAEPLLDIPSAAPSRLLAD